jgi:hypothetical protein
LPDLRAYACRDRHMNIEQPDRIFYGIPCFLIKTQQRTFTASAKAPRETGQDIFVTFTANYSKHWTAGEKYFLAGKIFSYYLLNNTSLTSMWHKMRPVQKNFKELLRKKTQLDLRSSCSVHGSYCSNTEQMGLTWALLSVLIMCSFCDGQWRRESCLLTNSIQPYVFMLPIMRLHREAQPKVSLRSQDLRLHKVTNKSATGQAMNMTLTTIFAHEISSNRNHVFQQLMERRHIGLPCHAKSEAPRVKRFSFLIAVQLYFLCVKVWNPKGVTFFPIL